MSQLQARLPALERGCRNSSLAREAKPRALSRRETRRRAASLPEWAYRGGGRSGWSARIGAPSAGGGACARLSDAGTASAASRISETMGPPAQGLAQSEDGHLG